MTKVAVVSTMDRGECVRQSIVLLEINPVHDKRVVLKPNFNLAHPAPGSMHNDTLRPLVLALQQMGAKQITLAE